MPLAVGAWSPGLPAAAVLSCSRRPFLIWEAAWLTLTAASYVCEEAALHYCVGGPARRRVTRDDWMGRRGCDADQRQRLLYDWAAGLTW